MVSKKPCVYRYDYHYHWFAITILLKELLNIIRTLYCSGLSACMLAWHDRAVVPQYPAKVPGIPVPVLMCVGS